MLPRRINIKSALLSICCIAVLFLACGTTDEAYSDTNDVTTTDLQTNVVGMETGGSSRATWVKVYLSVTDQDGTPLENFTAGNFTITEASESGSSEIGTGDVTVEVVGQSGGAIVTPLTMDYSGSMGLQDLADMETACSTFVTKMSSVDKGEIIKFASSVEVVQAFTSDQNLLIAAIKDSLGPSGMTALYDAIYRALVDACPETGLRAVLAFTDGKENYSSHTLADIYAKADSCLLAVYTIGLGSIDSTGLQAIADSTGGRFFYAPTSAQLDSLYNLISGQLSKTYTLKWNIQSASGESITVTIVTSYTCAAGDLKHTATGTFTAP